jgi:hypothetical protein
VARYIFSTPACDTYLIEPIINSDKPNQASRSETESSQSKRKGIKNRDAMDSELCETKLSSQSEGWDTQAENKGGKNQDAMDIEQSDVHTGLGREEISSAVKIDGETRTDLCPPPVESVASTSDGRTSRTATKVQAFSGPGRTLSETGKSSKQ